MGILLEVYFRDLIDLDGVSSLFVSSTIAKLYLNFVLNHKQVFKSQINNKRTSRERRMALGNKFRIFPFFIILFFFKSFFF